MRFRDRHEAGTLLGERLRPFRTSRTVVLALPRGGVPVGAAMADALGVPLDVVVALDTPSPFGMVSDSYADFAPVSDAAVLALLKASAAKT